MRSRNRHWIVSATAVQLAGVDPDAKLALLQFVLSNTDLQVSAHRAVGWLVAHSPVEQAVVIHHRANGESREKPFFLRLLCWLCGEYSSVSSDDSAAALRLGPRDRTPKGT